MTHPTDSSPVPADTSELTTTSSKTMEPMRNPQSRLLRAAPVATSVAIYTVLAVIGWWSAWSNDPSSVAISAGGDPAASMWFLTWAPYTLLHPHNPFFSNYGNYPYGLNMLVNTATLPLGYLMAPVTLLAGPVFSYNAISTLAPILGACSAYALIRRFTSWKPAAFVGGLLFGFSPFVVAQGLGHLHLEFIALLPLIFLGLHDLVVRQRGRPEARGALLGLLIVVQFFISSELLFDTLIMGIAGVAVVAFLGRASVRDHLVFALRGLAVTTVIVVVLLAYPVWFLLDGPGHVVGAIQTSPQAYRANLLGSIVPDSLQRIAPSAFTPMADKFSGVIVENGSYLGIPLVLFLTAASIVLRRHRVVLVAALLAAFALVMSLGSYPEVGNRGYRNVTLPETFLAKLPLAKNVIPARFSLFVALFAAVVLAVALDRLHAARLWGWSGRLATVVPLIVGIGLLVPLIPAWPYQMQATVPAYFTSNAAQAIPPNSVVLFYPFPDAYFANPDLWQATTFLRFEMPGGRFNVPEPGTEHEGSSRSSLTDSVLYKLARGVSPGKHPALRAEVDDQLRSWHVRTVIAAPAGARPARAIVYLTWLLGRAPTQSHGMMVWYNWNFSPPG